jgi:hypothetical protein
MVLTNHHRIERCWGAVALCLLTACASSPSSTPPAPDATATAASAFIAAALAKPSPEVQVATAVAATLTATAPTATPSPPPPTSTDTPIALAVAQPIPTDTSELAPTNPPTAQCQTDGPFHTFGSEYLADLGCSLNDAEVGTITIEPFQGGYLAWIKADDLIYAIGDDGRWSAHPNSWQAGEASLPYSAAQTYGYPAMGFGKLWCSNVTINRMLGAPRGPEEPNDSAQRQLFENGQIFRVQGGRTFILLHDGTGWIL